MSNFKVSGFYDEVSDNLVEQLELIKEFGESYICPRQVNGKNIADFTIEQFKNEVKPLLDKYNVKISSIGSPLGKINLMDEEAHKKELVKLESLVEICKLTDCKYIRIFSYFPPSGKDIDSCHDMVVSKLKNLLSKVEGTDIILLHENEKEIYGDIPTRCIKLYESLNHPNFKLAYDASNYVQCSVDPDKAYDMVKDYTVYYHIKDCSSYKVEVPLGTGIANYQRILAELKDKGYDGFLTLEPHTKHYATFKIKTYLMPFARFIRKNDYLAFKMIDKAMGIKSLQKVTKKQVFEWQYNALKNMIIELEE